VTSTDLGSLRAAAARNNAEWCAAVCRSHGIPEAFGAFAWTSSGRPPLYYPDAVTLRPDTVPADFLPAIDAARPGCSVKDSFASLDLTGYGFRALFDAQWIHRPAGIPVPAAVPGLRAAQVPVGRLGAWQAAWHGDDETPDVFRPALLDDPAVRVLAVEDGTTLAGGAVLNRTAELIGLSNLFAVGGTDPAAIWSCALTAATDHFPGLPIVGYEHGNDLLAALDGGFSPLGPLRVWLREG
jgi:hypothetical protein